VLDVNFSSPCGATGELRQFIVIVSTKNAFSTNTLVEPFLRPKTISANTWSKKWQSYILNDHVSLFLKKCALSLLCSRQYRSQ
jgi:hypothetical protein